MGNTLHDYITGKILKKTSKGNKTDSTKKCHNRGLNPEHKVAREIGPQTLALDFSAIEAH